MSWKEQPLVEIANCELGKMLDKNKNKGEYEPYLSNVDVRWGYFELDDLKKMRFESREFERFSLKAGDIIMCEGGEAGRCAVWQETTPKMMYQKALHRIRPLDGVESKFLYYTFLNMGKQNEIEPYYTGTTIKHLPLQILKKIPIKIAPLETQKRIASILSAYDDLIENNHKRIKLLEETAQNIYKEWFVNFRFPNYEHTEFDEESGLPMGWKESFLKNHCPILTGKKDANHSNEKGSYPFFTCGKENLLSTDYAFDNDAILLAGNGDFNVKYYRGKFQAYQRTYVLTPNKKSELFLLFINLKINLKQLTSGSKGSVIKFLTKGMIENHKFILPTEELINHFDDNVSKLYSQVENLNTINQKLKEARDILLPRLMNRTIEV